MRPLIADCERGLARLLPPAERTSGP
jgi:hypothetical protein